MRGLSIAVFLTLTGCVSAQEREAGQKFEDVVQMSQEIVEKEALLEAKKAETDAMASEYKAKLEEAIRSYEEVVAQNAVIEREFIETMGEISQRHNQLKELVASRTAMSEKVLPLEQALENSLSQAGSNVMYPAVSNESGRASLAMRANFAEAMQKVEERQLVFGPSAEHVSLDGALTQGGLAFGQTLPGAKVRLDGEDVMVGEDGRFVIGFERDAPSSALLLVTLPDGEAERLSLKIEDRDFPVQRIDGLDQSKVSGFTEEQLAKITVDSAKKKAARDTTQKIADWAGGFDWPATGPISGVFGSQRILNGEPKRPHSGLDVAAAAGTPVRAPADGVVRLAEPDMYFEGGLILLDHGHWLESALMHMSRLDVKPGQHVRKGDVIGAVGSTGRATGPHLHWSLKWSGHLVDPQLLVQPPDANAQPASAGK